MTDSLLDRLLHETGVTPEQYASEAAQGRFVPGRMVTRSPEFRRILALPRRDWEAREQAHVENYFTQHLRAPGGTQRLRPVQVAALWEMHDRKGMFAQIRTGGGKTAISLLGFIVLGSIRPLLLVPASLRDKTLRDMNAYRKHWLVPPYLNVKSYELLGREQSANMLEEYKPDVIIMDEAHRVKNRAASVTRRLARYIDTHPETKVVAMSGTIAKRSIKDYAHISNWCLRAGSPVPRDFQTLVEWAMALDDSRENESALEPGALIELCNEEEMAHTDRLIGVRRGYRRRLTDTPGVIATQESALGVSLRIDPLIVKDSKITTAAGLMRSTWERPDGVEMIDAIELWRHLRELSVGFYYRWNPPPPKVWRDARKNWAAFVREILRTNRRGLDSEKQVMTAIDSGLYPSDALRAWRAVKDSYDPEANKEAVWISDAVLKACTDWANKNVGIIWVKQIAFGQELAKHTKLPYYANQGVDAATGRFIDDHGAGPMIASIDSNATGRNLQRWSANLVVSWPTTGLLSEQMISRTHRDGQEAEEVTVEVVASIPEALSDFDRACADARRATDMEGQEQRLCYADITVPPLSERGALWT